MAKENHIVRLCARHSATANLSIQSALEPVSDTWNAISAPPKTPAPIVAKLNATINEVLKAPEMQSHLSLMHLQAVGGTPQQMAEIVKADTQRWGDVIRAANVTIE